MKLIVGLGNPGREYEKTRHNVGFFVIDELSSRFNIPLTESKFKGIFGKGIYQGEKVIIAKPLTYMNLSGEMIAPLMDYYDIDLSQLIVVYDDLDIPTGKLRLRERGSAGGHNGIKSTIQHLGTDQFNRIRIGISRPPAGMKVPDYVLGRFTEEEMIDIRDSVKKSADACERFLSQSFLKVMNDFNQ